MMSPRGERGGGGEGFHALPSTPPLDSKYALKEQAPISNTEPKLTREQVQVSIHWLRGGDFDEAHDYYRDLIEQLLPGSYIESPGYGGFMYKRHHLFAHGLKVYFEPSADNMPPVLIECPGEACEVLGYSKLQTLFCNARLTRVDVAFDHAPFTPKQVDTWVREGNIRCRAKKHDFHSSHKIRGESLGETAYIGARNSPQYLRVYNARGFTRVELELKEKVAHSFNEILLLSPEEFSAKAVGVLREFIDFVDSEKDSNVSRAPLLPLWEEFISNAERVKIRTVGVVTQTLESVTEWLETQVSAMLSAFAKAGGSVGELLKIGQGRLKRKHRLLIASAGVVNGLS